MAAENVYDKFAMIAIMIFCIILAFYVLKAFWNNIRGGGADPLYVNSLKPVLINSLIIFSLLGIGVTLPRFITTITLEPVADMTLVYTQSMLDIDDKFIEEKVTYKPMQMSEDGFYRPQLRDKIIKLMKTTVTQFQSYMKLGVAIMDKAFSWSAILSLGSLIKHIIIFAMGLYLLIAFFKLFIKFCFYFVDAIVALAYFAFFFPLSLVLFIFQGQKDAPKWLSGLGKGVGTDQFRSAINAIVTLAAVVITYTVIMVIIAKFFSADGQSSAELMKLITNGEIFARDLSDENLAAVTLIGAIVLVYVLNFLASQIGKISDEVLKSFDPELKIETTLGESLGKDMLKVGENITNFAKKTIDTITGKTEKKEEEGK